MTRPRRPIFQTRARVAPPGSAPGTLRELPVGLDQVRLTAIHYDRESLTTREVSPVDFPDLALDPRILWLHVQGADAATLRHLGQSFGLHPLLLEDVAGGEQRAKVDEYPDSLFVVLWMILDSEGFHSEQFSLALGRRFVISFQNGSRDCLDPVRVRLRRAGLMRDGGPDYLAYALIDAVIDHYFPVVEHIGDRLEILEEDLLGRSTVATIAQIQGLRRELLSLRKHIWPLREVLATLVRRDSPLICAGTSTYLRDCSDHVAQVLDVTESYRELAASLVDLHLTAQGQHMNEIMKVLTIIATIFMPMSFIASVYGMNFVRDSSPWNMPELGWRFGYPFALFLMFATAMVQLYAFWRRGWLKFTIPRRRSKPHPSNARTQTAKASSKPSA